MQRSRRRWLQGAAALGLACGRERAVEPTAQQGWPYPSPRPGPAWPHELDWAFDRSQFAALPDPQPGDWLAEQSEPGQDVEQFLADEPNRPTPPRDTIVIQPLRMLHRDVELAAMRPSPVELVDWLARFFALDVTIAEPLLLPRSHVGVRMNHGHEQWNAGDINEQLRDHLPARAYCCIGVTTTDLFPEPSWNFVYGQASLSERVGVFSLARYDDAFFGRPPSDPLLVRRRGLGVVAHEVGHMFGMQHCVHHLCLMNGSNNQEEADRAPLHLCAICLRKLHLLVGFDPAERYAALAGFFRTYGLDREREWTEARLDA
jgi:archaemetzincin